MAEYTPTPWATDGSYVVAKNGPTIADCFKSPSLDKDMKRANAAFIIKAVNAHDELVKALKDILKANDDFRASMPDGWEGDPLQDACEAARRLLTDVSGAKGESNGN